MGIPEWLSFVKDRFKDASAYSMVAEQVSMLEERIKLRDDRISDLVSKIADLESQLASFGAEFAAKSEQATKLEGELRKFREADQFDEIHGYAFKRKPGGGFEPAPRCPGCHSFLSINEKSKWTEALICQSCKYARSGES